MAQQKRLFFGLVTFAVVFCLVLMFWAMGRYERGRRAATEEDDRARFAALAEQLPDMEKLRRIPVSFKERVQPLDSVARSTLREFSGKRDIYGQDPVLVFLSLCFDGNDYGWDDIPLFFVKHSSNRTLLDLPSWQKLATARQIRESEGLMGRIREILPVIQNTPALVTEEDRELQRLMNLSGYMRELESLFVSIPPSRRQLMVDDASNQDWHHPVNGGGHPPAAVEAIQEAFAGIRQGWRDRNMEQLNDATNRFTSLCAELGPGHIPDAVRLDREISFNAANPVNRSSYFYIAASLIMTLALFLRLNWARWLAIAVGIAGLTLHGWGIYLRTTLGFGVAITNLYESMVALAAGMMLLCIILDIVKRIGWFTMVGGLGSFVVLQVIEYAYTKFDDGIGGTIAVLANNVWVHIHVPVVMFSYGAYVIAFILAGIGLIWILFNDRRAQTPELRTMLGSAAICVNIGTIFIFCGIVLGGIWADVSWGRFWGWDPKETWALILFLYYIVVVHGRFTKWLTPFWSCWMMSLGGLVLLWTYYGSNELFSGLHSYANSAGGAGFWDNLVHDRNRWFVMTSGIMVFLLAGSWVWYALSGGNRLPATADADTHDKISPEKN